MTIGDGDAVADGTAATRGDDDDEEESAIWDGPAAAQREGDKAAAVSRSCACIGSPCLRHCGHGASIGGGGGGRPHTELRVG
jgi:hypothetical protein